LAESTPDDHYAVIVIGIASIFDRDRQFLDSFLDAGLHLLLRIDIGHVSRELSVILLFIFSYRPDVLSPELMADVANLAAGNAKDILSYMHLYLTYDPPLPHVSLAYQIVFDRTFLFIERGLSLQLAKNLQYYMSHTPNFTSQHLSNICAVFGRILGVKDETLVTFVSEIILADQALSQSLASVNLEVFLMRQDVHRVALLLCQKYPEQLKYTPEIMKALLCNAQRSKVASRIILRAVETEEVAVVTSNMASIWISVALPTLKWTYKLLTAISKFKTVKPAIANCPSFPNLLQQLATSDVPKLWSGIAPTVKSIGITRPLVKNCAGTHFFEYFYKFGLGANDASRLADVLTLTDAFARVGYAQQYLLLIKPLGSLVTNSGWRPFAVSLIAALSLHPAARVELAKAGFRQTLIAFREDEKLRPYIEVFLKHTPEG
jgi:hypothetical protein